MTARAIMIQGTGSDVGKSLLVAGLARAFTRRGLRVRPFKPQNMSNNAAVTADGGEIGRAQALQARAARVPPSVHMNPVLLKPQSDVGAQVVVQGKVLGNAKAREYQGMKPRLLGAVLDSFGRLAAEADLVLVEGAGSASEVNLRANDIANMGFARAADVPVVLMGDIDRGGVIASLVGTKAVIDPADAAHDRGLHRQPLPRRSALFDDGMDGRANAPAGRHWAWCRSSTTAHRLPAEDAVVLQDQTAVDVGALLMQLDLALVQELVDLLDVLEGPRRSPCPGSSGTGSTWPRDRGTQRGAAPGCSSRPRSPPG